MEFPFSKGSRPGKTRKGSIPINVKTLSKQKRHGKDVLSEKLSSVQFRAFAEALREKWAAGEYNPTYAAPMAGTMTSAGIQRAPTQSPDDDAVSEEEAEEALKDITKKKNIGRHLGVATVGGVSAPLIASLGRATKGFVDTPGSFQKRLSGAARGVGTATAGDVASQALTGALAGGVGSLNLENIQLRQARGKLRKFLRQRRGGDGAVQV